MPCLCWLVAISFVWVPTLELTGQNLIPDPKFDLVNTATCQTPPEAIALAEHWFAVVGTPDLYMGACSDIWASWPFSYPFREGNSYGGIVGSVQENGRMTSELIATNLSEPLEADRIYHFQLNVRNRGIWHPDREAIYCPTDPARAIEVFTYDRWERSQPILDPNPPFPGGTRVASFSDEDLMTNEASDEWKTYQTCFVGRGAHSQLGIAFPVAQDASVPPCVTDPALTGFFGFHYAQLDEATLIPLPEPQRLSLSLCEEELSVAFDAQILFPDPRAMALVRFFWEDGEEGPIRIFSQPGQYPLSLQTDCGEVAIDVWVEQFACQALAYVPNAFSPNGDGRNDDLAPFLKPGFPVSDYSFQVFDRWGSLVYESSDWQAPGWNGSYRGRPAAKGTYLWVLRFTYYQNENPQTYRQKGELILLR